LKQEDGDNFIQELQLARACIAGQLECFDTLMERSEAIVRGMLFNLVQDRMQADELAQQSFVSAFEHLRQFKGESRFSTWVCRIAINKFNDYLRSLQRQNRVMVEPSDRASNENIEENISDEQRRALVSRAINSLRANDREMLVMKYLCDYSYEEIAALYGCSAETVKMRNARAREAFRKVIRKMGLSYDN